MKESEAVRLHNMTKNAIESETYKHAEWLEKHKGQILLRLEESARAGSFFCKISWNEFTEYPSELKQKALINFLIKNEFQVITDPVTMNYGIRIDW